VTRVSAVKYMAASSWDFVPVRPRARFSMMMLTGAYWMFVFAGTLGEAKLISPERLCVGLTDIAARSWRYVTLGYVHGEQWWRAFCYRLRMAGYDGWLPIRARTSC